MHHGPKGHVLGFVLHVSQGDTLGLGHALPSPLSLTRVDATRVHGRAHTRRHQ